MLSLVRIEAYFVTSSVLRVSSLDSNFTTSFHNESKNTGGTFLQVPEPARCQAKNWVKQDFIYDTI